MSSVSYTILHVEDLAVNIRPTTSGHALTMKGSTVGQAGGSEVTIHVSDSTQLEQIVSQIQRYLRQEKTHDYREQYAESSRVGCVF